MDSVFTYLPVYLLGRTPPTPSNLRLIPTEKYYGALVLLAPLVLLAEWLFSSSVVHLVLRLSNRRSDIDRLLNISGFVALSIGSIIVVWDGLWSILGGMNQYLLGASHLIIIIWEIAIGTVAFKRILDVPVWLGILLNVVAAAVSMPFAIMFMRSPV